MNEAIFPLGGTTAHSTRQNGADRAQWEQPAGDGAERTGRSIQSVERALTILQILAAAREPMMLSDLAGKARINVSTCHHIVATLVGRGFVLHAGRNRGYMLSSKLRELTEMGARELDLSEFVRPALTALAEQLAEGVQMAVLRDNALMTQLRVGSSSCVAEPDELRKMSALHATATGKAILAWLPETEMARVISANGLNGYTDRTITTLSGLIEELRHVRRSGFAIDNEELDRGVVCVGAAVRDEKGAVIASISATFAAHKNSDAYRNHVIRHVKDCARTLSDRLKVSRF